MTVIGIAAGSGGVGASVLTAALSVRAAQARRPVVAVDGRRYAGGLEVTFGAEQEDGLRWTDLVRARGRIDGAALLDRLPAVDQVPVLSYDRDAAAVLPAETVAAVVAGLATAVDLVVVDLPRPGEELFAAFVAMLDGFVLLSGVGVGSLAGAGVVVPAVRAVCPRGWLVARGAARARFGAAVAEALGMPLLAWVGDDRSVAPDLLHGRPPGRRPGPLADAADEVLAVVLDTLRTSPSTVAVAS